MDKSIRVAFPSFLRGVIRVQLRYNPMENIDSLGYQAPILGRFVDSLGLYASHDMLWKTLSHF